MEDPFLLHFILVFLPLEPPWSKSNKNLSLPHLKTTGGINPEYEITQQVLPD
jgi:hypothetical protein